MIKRIIALVCAAVILFAAVVPVAADDGDGGLIQLPDGGNIIPLPDDVDWGAVANIIGSFLSGTIGIDTLIDGLKLLGVILEWFEKTPEEQLIEIFEKIEKELRTLEDIENQLYEKNQQLIEIENRFVEMVEAVQEQQKSTEKIAESTAGISKAVRTAVPLWVVIMAIRWLWRILWGWMFKEI